MGRFRTIRIPVSFDGERALEVLPPPVLGEHDDELLGRVAARRSCRIARQMVACVTAAAL